LREICKEYEIVLIDDEVQAGVGRARKMWACEHTNTTPDIMCDSKSIDAGIPLAIVIVKDEIEKNSPIAFIQAPPEQIPLGMLVVKPCATLRRNS